MPANGLPTKLGRMTVSSERYNMDFIKSIPKIVIYDLKYNILSDLWEIVFHHESLDEVAQGTEPMIYRIRSNPREGVEEYEFYY